MSLKTIHWWIIAPILVALGAYVLAAAARGNFSPFPVPPWL